LVIGGRDVGGHDEALSLLETVSAAVFFELDLIHKVPLMLSVDPNLARRQRDSPKAATNGYRSPKLPMSRYSEEAVSLYSYARSAYGMPLLEFLAYYQVAEYYFRQFAQGEIIQRLKQELRDPRFDRDDDRDVARLMSLAGGASGKSFLSELDQLTATIAGSVDEATLRQFLEDRPLMLKALSDKSTIRGVPPLNLKNSNERVVDQVARRIYGIRCRIVHTKEDGGKTAQPMLLPFGEEARSLRYDIALMRFIARQVLVARAVAAPWIRR
jgi:hypothetical protein